MNLIICNEKCQYQNDGYCFLETNAEITNVLASPCRYFKDRSPIMDEKEKANYD